MPEVSLSAGKLAVQGIGAILVRTRGPCRKQQVQGHEEVDDGDKHQQIKPTAPVEIMAATDAQHNGTDRGNEGYNISQIFRNLYQ